ncbi:MAG TPA: NAD-dependent epimerase/dehydratase family protein [Mycobacteriales bacterium]|nr:NAD-dependent epimerase/dehydratase family protein [Mycobacteriales bacterium]
MKALVTGAAGFLGSHVCDRLVADGHLVTGLDDLSTGHLSNIAAVRRRKGFSFHHFDVGSELVADLLARERPEVVVHAAPVLPVHLLAAARAVGSRVVVAGSAEVYGPTQAPVTERSGTHPANLAGAHHAAVEAYVHAHVNRGLDAATLRLTSVYGPRSRGVVTRWARALRAGRPTYVRGDGSAVRDLVHVDDVVDAVVRCLGGKADGRRLNLGTGTGTTVRRLHSAVAAAVGGADAPEFRAASEEDLASVRVDPGGARRALGWEATVGLTEGLSRTLDVTVLRRR